MEVARAHEKKKNKSTSQLSAFLFRSRGAFLPSHRDVRLYVWLWGRGVLRLSSGHVFFYRRAQGGMYQADKRVQVERREEERYLWGGMKRLISQEERGVD